MEGVYTFAVATAISILMVILVGLRPSKWTVLLATLLYVVAITVWFIPLFPATNATDKDVTNTMLWIILCGALVLCIASFWVVEWIETLQSINSKILAAENIVSESYYAIEGLYQTRLWAIDQNCNYSEINEEYSECIFPLGREPQPLGGIGHSYQSAINALRNKYDKYLVDDFDYEEHFVKYEIVEF